VAGAVGLAVCAGKMIGTKKHRAAISTKVLDLVMNVTAPAG
jgi:hypothetical protein